MVIEHSLDNPDVSVTEQLTLSIADLKEIPPTQLSPLYETVNPDILQELAQHPPPGLEFTFEYEACNIVLTEETLRIHPTVEGTTLQDSTTTSTSST